jgi:hypothetical protein
VPGFYPCYPRHPWFMVFGMRAVREHRTSEVERMSTLPGLCRFVRLASSAHRSPVRWTMSARKAGRGKLVIVGLCMPLILSSGCHTFRPSQTELEISRDQTVGKAVATAGTSLYWVSELFPWFR